MIRLYRVTLPIALLITLCLAAFPAAAMPPPSQGQPPLGGTAEPARGDQALALAVAYCKLSADGATVHARWSNLFGKVEWLHVWAKP